MNWKWMDLFYKNLNPPAIREWTQIFLQMEIWMQAVVFGLFVFLIGICILECWWGWRMNVYARFAAGFALGFHVFLIILTAGGFAGPGKALLYAALAGAVLGALNAWLERVFQFAVGFVFGTVFSSWFLPACFHLKLSSGGGRIWSLVICVAAGALFALAAKKAGFLLTALTGGIVLGNICCAFLPAGKLPLDKIPFLSEKLSKGQLKNLIPILIAASGALIQLLQVLADRKARKELEIPSGESLGHAFESGSVRNTPGQDQAGSSSSEEKDADTITMAQAEAVLVEKARELAQAASRSTQSARARDRYEDVAEGLYGADVAAKKLGMTEEEFLEGMKRCGYGPAEEEASGAAAAGSETAAEETGAAAAGSETAAEETGTDEAGIEALEADSGSEAKDTGAETAVPESDEEDAGTEETVSEATAEGSDTAAADPEAESGSTDTDQTEE